MYFHCSNTEKNQVFLDEKSSKGESAISMLWERWFLSSNAKDIGILYLIFALFSGLLGTAFSVLIRMELSGPGVQYLAGSQLYNNVITAHAILILFFMVMPAMIGGFGNFLLPLLIGGPDMAFPRLNNISFWLLPPSLILFIFAATMDNIEDTVFVYPALGGLQNLCYHNVDWEIYALYISVISSLLGVMNFIATLFLSNYNVYTRNIKLILFLIFIFILSLYLDSELYLNLYHRKEFLYLIIWLFSFLFTTYKLLISPYVKETKSFFSHIEKIIVLIYNNAYLVLPILIGSIVLSYSLKLNLMNLLEIDYTPLTYLLLIYSIWLPVAYVSGIVNQIYTQIYYLYPALSVNYFFCKKIDFSFAYINNNITVANFKNLVLYILCFRLLLGTIYFLYNLEVLHLSNLECMSDSPDKDNKAWNDNVVITSRGMTCRGVSLHPAQPSIRPYTSSSAMHNAAFLRESFNSGLMQIYTAELDKVITNSDHYIAQFSKFINDIGAVQVKYNVIVVEEYGSLSVDVPQNMSETIEKEIVKKVRILDSLCTQRCIDIESELSKGRTIENYIKLIQPRYTSKISGQIAEFSRLRGAFK